MQPHPDALAPSHHPSTPRAAADHADTGDTADADAGGCDGPLPSAAAGVPPEINVSANANTGVYLVDRRAVRCFCAGCAEARRRLRGGGDHLVSPTEFERHSGIPAAKKWRFSIKVTHAGEPAVTLGRWLELKDLDQKQPRRGKGGGRHSPGTSPAKAAAAAPGDQARPRGAADAPAGAGAGAEGRLGRELDSGRADAMVQLTRVAPPPAKQGAAASAFASAAALACPLAEEAPAVASGTATPAAAAGSGAGSAGASGSDDMVAEEAPLVAAAHRRQQHQDPPAAAAARAFPPPRLEVESGGDDGAGGPAEPPNDDSQWMQSPRRLKTPRGGPTPRSGAPPAAQDAAAGDQDAPGSAAAGAPADQEVQEGDGEEDEEEEEEGIRVGPEFQATLPAWRPRPSLRGLPPAAQKRAAAAIAAELARCGPSGPSEAAAVLIALQEKLRAETLPPDAIDDLWERREPALALERGQRQRRAPGWMQGEQFVHQMAGAAAGRGGGDEDEDATSSDHGGAGRRVAGWTILRLAP